MTPDLAPFFAAIDAAPEDSLRVGLLADYLEERGHEWWPPMRWAYVNGKRPEWRAECACWWDSKRKPDYSQVPFTLYWAGVEQKIHNIFNCYPSECWVALCETWVEVGGLEAVAC